MSDLSELKSNFDNLKSVRLNIRRLFESLQGLTHKLKALYLDYIEISKKTNQIFGIDSFHFQKMLIDLEYESMEKMYQLIDNKMYCEYYKLFKLISRYASENISDKKIQEICKLKSKYPVYKDLDQYKVYEFELINDLHHDIIQLLDEMTSYTLHKETELKLEEERSQNGLNIDNYVNKLMFDNAIIIQNIKLYKRYLQVFHKYHNTYLSRLYIKLGIMWGQLNQDIHLNSSGSSASTSTSIPLGNSSVVNNSSNIETLSKPRSVTPTISSRQQEEIYKFMKDSGVNNEKLNGELANIISHISSENEDSIDEGRSYGNLPNGDTSIIIEEKKQEIKEVIEETVEEDEVDADNEEEVIQLVEQESQEVSDKLEELKAKKRLKKKRYQQNKKAREQSDGSQIL